MAETLTSAQPSQSNHAHLSSISAANHLLFNKWCNKQHLFRSDLCPTLDDSVLKDIIIIIKILIIECFYSFYCIIINY